MATVNPAYYNLGNPVTTSERSWMDLAERAWGAEWNAPDHRIYEWSNGRGFDSTDQGVTGFYNRYSAPGTNTSTGTGTGTGGPLLFTLDSSVLDGTSTLG